MTEMTENFLSEESEKSKKTEDILSRDRLKAVTSHQSHDDYCNSYIAVMRSRDLKRLDETRLALAW